jgi:HK97 family phage prohead protease
MDLEYKHLTLEQAKVLGEPGDTGTVEGYLSVFGKVDSYGDTIVPGAYSKWLDYFRTNGFMSWNHDWSQMIGTPVDVHEDAVGLFYKAQFHSTAAAQEARTIAAERLARGLNMGFSIGFKAWDWEYRENPDGHSVRALKEIQVFEGALVAVPADSYALVAQAKSRDAARHADQPGESITYADHGSRVLADLAAFTARSRDLSDLRAKEGRVLSAANRERLQAVLDALDGLDAVRSALGELLATSDPTPKRAPDLALLRLQYDHTRALLAEPLGA